MKAPKGQREDSSVNENIAAGDPNIVGKSPTAPVQDRRAGLMTACQEYDSSNEFYPLHTPRQRY